MTAYRREHAIIRESMLPRAPAIGQATRSLLLAILALLLASDAEALEGRLIDGRTLRPVVGAQVSIAGMSGTSQTDGDGRFEWHPDPAPPFVILIVLPGGRFAAPVRIESIVDTPLVIQVDPNVAETIVVVGSAPSVEAPPGASTALVSSADIGRHVPANLTAALENVSGVSSVAEGQSSVPAIRGLARGRTLVLLDGSRLFSERRAGPSVSFLAPETFERIDVVRGPSSVAYGSDAFGGVISVLTRRPSIDAPFAGRVAATVGAGIPNRRAEVEMSLRLGPAGGLLVHAHRRSADDYSSPDGVVLNSAWDDRGALARVVMRAGGLWSAAWQGDFAGPSGLPRSDSATLRVSYPFERSQRGSLSFERSGMRWFDQFSLSALIGHYTQRLDQDRLAAPGRPRRIDRADIHGDDVQLRAVARKSIGSARVTAGADVSERHGLSAHDIAILFNSAGTITSVTDNASIASARKSDGGAFAQVDVPVLPAVRLSAGGRLDRIRNVNVGGFFGDRKVSRSAPSGSLAAVLRLSPRIGVTAQASRGFHDATLSDRFYRGPVGRGVITGNPDLEPERSLQLDVTTRYEGGRWWAQAAYYHYDISHLIERYQSAPDTFLFRNRGLAAIRGVEVEAHLDAGRVLAFDVSGQAGRGRAKDDGAPLDDVAPRSAVLRVSRIVGGRMFVAARVAAFARDRSPGPSETATPGYVEAGATASWRISRRLEIRFSTANLLDRRYYSSPSPRGVLAPGRNGALTVVAKF